MNFSVDYRDKLWVKRAKLFYLVPVFIVAYPFMVVYYGVKECGNPFPIIRDIWIATEIDQG